MSDTGHVPAISDTGHVLPWVTLAMSCPEWHWPCPALSDTGHVPALSDTGHVPALSDTGHVPTLSDTGHVPALSDTGHVPALPGPLTQCTEWHQKLLACSIIQMFDWCRCGAQWQRPCSRYETVTLEGLCPCVSQQLLLSVTVEVQS